MEGDTIVGTPPNEVLVPISPSGNTLLFAHILPPCCGTNSRSLPSAYQSEPLLPGLLAAKAAS